MQDKKKVWIFFSNTGGGHRSAASAIETALREVLAKEHKEAEFELVMESIAENSHPINKFFVWLYNYLLCHKQSWMKYYFAFINWTKPNNSALGYSLIKPFLNELLTRAEPNVIVSVHPMLNHYLARNRHDLGLTGEVRLIEVITDPNKDIWNGWACNDMDLIVAPNDLAREALIEGGVSPERIRVLGMPVNPIFLRPSTKSKADFMAEVGLDTDKLTVCLNAGWAGGGNMRKVYEKLSLVKRPFQTLFLCGYNTELYEQIKKDSQTSPVKTAVLPFHKNMVDVMSHSDLMVSKGGGLTTFEAIAKRLPIAFDVITEPMPQERGTIEMLLKQGICQAVRKPEDIVAIVENLQPLPDRETRPLPAEHSLNKTSAANEIAKIIIASCEPSFDLVCDTVPFHPVEPFFEPAWDVT